MPSLEPRGENVAPNATQHYETWRQRSRHSHWRVLYLDGVHFSIRHGEKADATIILTADGAWI